MHRLIIEAWQCKRHGLKECSDFITEVINTLKTHEIGRLQFNITNKIPGAKPGITINVVFLESHLALHTWPEENSFVDLEISSCKEFPVEKLHKGFQLFFNPSRILVKEI